MDGSTELAAPTELARHRLTVDDVEAMLDSGILSGRERVELIGGELIEMPAEGKLHSDVKSALILRVAAAAMGRYAIGPDTPLRLSDIAAPEPDLFVMPQGMRASDTRGPDTLLVVEVSDSTYGYDLGGKADLYAHYGVREYWVVDVRQPKIQVHHLQPNGEYEAIEVSVDQVASPRLAPEIKITLADLL